MSGKRVTKADLLAVQSGASTAVAEALTAQARRFYAALLDEGPDVLERVLARLHKEPGT